MNTAVKKVNSKPMKRNKKSNHNKVSTIENKDWVINLVAFFHIHALFGSWKA